MANQIGPDTMNSPYWSATRKTHGGFLALDAKSCAERNAATFCSRKNLALAVLKMDNRELKSGNPEISPGSVQNEKIENPQTRSESRSG